MERRVVRRSQSYFTAPDGARLFRRAWMPPTARRALAIVHGFAEHSGRYDHVGAWFSTRDCAVHAYDHRGPYALNAVIMAAMLILVLARAQIGRDRASRLA